MSDSLAHGSGGDGDGGSHAHDDTTVVEAANAMVDVGEEGEEEEDNRASSGSSDDEDDATREANARAAAAFTDIRATRWAFLSPQLFVVSGYTICSASLASAASIETVAPVETRGNDSLRSLEMTSWYQRGPGLVAQFVEMYGQSLRSLSLIGNENSNFSDDVSFDEDLEAVLSCCPHLETRANRAQAPTSALIPDAHSPLDSAPHRLHKLMFEYVSIPPLELIQFLTHLGDPRIPTLESFEFDAFHGTCFAEYDAGEFVSVDQKFVCVNAAVIDAALTMLGTNRTLQHFCLCCSRKLWKAYHQRFDAEVGVRVKAKTQLPLRVRLAFLSVMQSEETSQDGALQRLDSGCLSSIFDFFTPTVLRRIEFLKSFD